MAFGMSGGANVVEIVLRAKDEASRTIEKTSQGLDIFGRKFALISAGMAAGGSAITAALVSVASKTAAAGGAIYDMSLKLGITAEKTQVLRYAAQQTGTALEAFPLIFKSIANAQDQAVHGNEQYIKSFQEVGLSVEDLKRLSLYDIFTRAAAGLSLMGDSTRGVAVGADLMGRGFMQLRPLLAEGPGALQGYEAELRKMNALMSDDAVRAAEAYGDSLNAMRVGFDAVRNNVGSALIPQLNSYINDVIIPGTARLSEFVREHEKLSKVGLGAGAGVAALGTAGLAVAGAGAAFGPVGAAIALTIATAAITIGTASIVGAVLGQKEYGQQIPSGHRGLYMLPEVTVTPNPADQARAEARRLQGGRLPIGPSMPFVSQRMRETGMPEGFMGPIQQTEIPDWMLDQRIVGTRPAEEVKIPTDEIKTGGDAFVSAAEGMTAALVYTTNTAETFGDWLGDAAVNALKQFIAALAMQKAASFLKSFLPFEQGGIIPGFQTGGLVPMLSGASPYRDSVMIAATPGEGILPPRLTRELRQVLGGGGGASHGGEPFSPSWPASQRAAIINIHYPAHQSHVDRVELARDVKYGLDDVGVAGYVVEP